MTHETEFPIRNVTIDDLTDDIRSDIRERVSERLEEHGYSSEVVFYTIDHNDSTIYAHLPSLEFETFKDDFTDDEQREVLHAVSYPFHERGLKSEVSGFKGIDMDEYDNFIEI